MENPNFRLGMTAIEVIAEIIRVHSARVIDYLVFYVYKPHYNKRELKKKNLLISDLLYHDPLDKNIVVLKREDIITQGLGKIISSLKEGSVLSVLSEAGTEDMEFRRSIAHIPLMDFSCRESPENLAKIESLLRTIGQEKGVILSSGRSYHYYGLKLMGQDEWLNFLGDCGLSGLCDLRYILHRLKDQRGILRLSTCPLRPKIPTVVSIL